MTDKLDGPRRFAAVSVESPGNGVSHLIAGASVFICDDCVELCVEIIEERKRRD
jgi:ATP-dependent protease Clp ATPase subunit